LLIALVIDGPPPRTRSKSPHSRRVTEEARPSRESSLTAEPCVDLFSQPDRASPFQDLSRAPLFGLSPSAENGPCFTLSPNAPHGTIATITIPTIS
jgi:hypothetical protein